MSSIKFHARNATFKYATGITIGDPIDSAFSAGTTVGIFKEVSVTGPEGDVSLTNYLGEDANGFQNADFEESAFSEAEITGTMVVDNEEILADIAFGSGTAGTSHTLHQVGDGSRPTTGAILVNLDNGTDEASVVLNNIIVTQANEISVTGSDGHWEMSFTAKCLPKDYYFEVKN